MSQENIDLYQRVVAAINTREISDAVAEELLARDFRIENVATVITDRTYRGAAGPRDWVRDTFEGLDETACYEIEEILADGEDFVVARVRLVGHGARSGAPVMLRWVAVAWIYDGKMTRSAGYLHRREALEAVGLAGLAVSQENVETVRRIFERWNAGDRSAVTEYLDPAMELQTPFSSVSGEPYRGHAGIEQWRRDIDEQFSEWRFRLDEVREVGDTVIAVGSVHGRGRGSGIEFDQPSALVAAFGTDNRITRARIYLDVDAAFDAVELER